MAVFFRSRESDYDFEVGEYRQISRSEPRAAAAAPGSRQARTKLLDLLLLSFGLLCVLQASLNVGLRLRQGETRSTHRKDPKPDQLVLMDECTHTELWLMLLSVLRWGRGGDAGDAGGDKGGQLSSGLDPVLLQLLLRLLSESELGRSQAGLQEQGGGPGHHQQPPGAVKASWRLYRGLSSHRPNEDTDQGRQT